MTQRQRNGGERWSLGWSNQQTKAFAKSIRQQTQAQRDWQPNDQHVHDEALNQAVELIWPREVERAKWQDD